MKRGESSTKLVPGRRIANWARHLFDQPLPRVGSLVPSVAPELERVVGKATEKDVRSRYQADAKFTTWLFRITTNIALNWRRDARSDDAGSAAQPGGPHRAGLRPPRPDHSRPGAALSQPTSQPPSQPPSGARYQPAGRTAP